MFAAFVNQVVATNSVLPDSAGGIGGSGASRLSYLKKVVQAPSLDVTGAKLDFHGLANGSAWLALM